MGIILTPLVAFGLYLLLAGIMSGTGKLLAATGKETEFKSGAYASGEAPPLRPALIGYQGFFLIALFFAILHLGVLVLATSAGAEHTPMVAVYLVGLAISLALLVVG